MHVSMYERKPAEVSCKLLSEIIIEDLHTELADETGSNQCMNTMYE
jgi:hypothetical protein